MPELPDIATYIHALQPRVVGSPLLGIRLTHPFVLRTAVPPVAQVNGRRVTDVTRMGKRIVLALDGDLFVVIHLMIAGRLHWKDPGAKLARKYAIAAFDFEDGTLTLTEAGSKHRASIHLMAGLEALKKLDPGGIDVLNSDLAAFEANLRRENHTLKRALTDPSLFSGIGNTYSDEILHRARLSPFAQTSRLPAEEASRLFDCVRSVLIEWIERLACEAGNAFPENVTAFREGMAVHGRYNLPCPSCGAPVQRIAYADNEANYCATCQTGGRLLADRALSRLLKDDWPRTLDELEARRANRSD